MLLATILNLTEYRTRTYKPKKVSCSVTYLG